MICYVCEKKIVDRYLTLSFNRDYYAEQEIEHTILHEDKAIGFHLECLKDSLGDDFWRFFKTAGKLDT
ncbi:MAG: hypothetical protein AABY22_30100 [Nanoarchaeota archaeon]